MNHRYACMLGLVAMSTAGCQAPATATYPMPYPEMARGYYQPNHAPYGYPNELEPAAGPVKQQASSVNNEIKAEVGKIEERIQRVEKAMLRLDRRMQLVERNELNRMGNGEISQNSEVAPVAQMTEMGPAYTDGFRPVSAIMSSLQAAPTGNMPTQVATAKVRGLPSLADPSAAVGGAPSGELAVWTIRYNAESVWPEREQLPMSRDVVEALRSGKPTTVFARGKHPQAVAFRERVKAVSRYLGKVASLESVPIAAIPAEYLDDATIEIFATH